MNEPEQMKVMTRRFWYNQSFTITLQLEQKKQDTFSIKAKLNNGTFAK